MTEANYYYEVTFIDESDKELRKLVLISELQVNNMLYHNGYQSNVRRGYYKIISVSGNLAEAAYQSDRHTVTAKHSRSDS